MTGWRVGWLAGPSDVMQQVSKLHESTTSCAPTVSQHAAIAALEGPQDAVDRMQQQYNRRRDYTLDRVASIPGLSCPPPEGGFYAFLDLRSTGESSFSLAEQLLEEYNVVTAPGSGFGNAGEGFLRISFATDIDQLAEGFDRIEDFMQTQ